MDLVIAVDDPDAHDDVRALLEGHLTLARQVTPPGHVHALGTDGLGDPAVTLYSARCQGELLAVGALRHLDAARVEVKSMHTTTAARGQGVGRALLTHLMTVALSDGYREMCLETGTMAAFAPARRLYHRSGFRTCPPFGPYSANPHSTCMSIELG